MNKTIEFTEEELWNIRKLVFARLDLLGREQDPRIEEWLAIDEKVSKALGIEAEGMGAFMTALISEIPEEER